MTDAQMARYERCVLCVAGVRAPGARRAPDSRTLAVAGLDRRDAPAERRRVKSFRFDTVPRPDCVLEPDQLKRCSIGPRASGT